MRASIMISLVGIAALHACRDASPRFTLEAQDVWIRDVTVVFLERANAFPNAHVVIRGDTIAWVGSEPPIAGPPGPTVIEGGGRYMVPGLIDGHVHLATVPGLSTEQVKAMPAVVAEYYKQLPRSYLYFGFTTVVDLNVTDRARIDSLRAADLAPTILDCDNAIVIANGYPMLFRPWPARFERYPNFLYDPRQADSIPKQYSAAEHSARANVARVASAGASCVKSFYEGGWAMSGWPVPTLEMMQQVKEEAHKRGLPLLAVDPCDQCAGGPLSPGVSERRSPGPRHPTRASRLVPHSRRRVVREDAIEHGEPT
ncbi:MAG: amidohydrolase family protein [Gemmatimonadaceae bacterium]